MQIIREFCDNQYQCYNIGRLKPNNCNKLGDFDRILINHFVSLLVILYAFNYRYRLEIYIGCLEYRYMISIPLNIYGNRYNAISNL